MNKDLVLYSSIEKAFGGGIFHRLGSGFMGRSKESNLELTFCGTTGKLKYSKVLKRKLLTRGKK